jgi:hypothetical protein
VAEPEQARLDVQVPDSVGSGVFADFVAVWHNQYGFTLDFGVLGLPTQDSEGRTTVPTPIVARVKVPPGLIFQIAQAIADNVDKYERAYGAITPRPPEAGPPPATT